VVSGWAKPGNEAVQINYNQTTNTSGTYTQQTGSLQVTISPPEAVAAGAQWRVDNNPWRDSGYTESGLSVGSHTVEYNAVSGWNKPADEAVQINDGQTTNTSGTYILQTGSLQVTISPPEAVAAGAQWRVDNNPWRNSGYTESGLSVGSHTVEYNTVSGWNKPADEVVQINDGQTTITSGTYTQQTGSLQVTISPPEAVAAGAQWRVDNNPWRDSGYTESGLSVGAHTVEYSTVSGWNKPADEAVQINDGQMTNTSGTYILQTGSLQVTISPAEAVAAGAQWRVDNNPWRDSGYTESGLPVGSHTVEYNTVSGWNKPADEIVQINDGQTTTTSGTYILQTGSLRVTISPQGATDAGAQWRVDGGTWRNSGYTESDLLVGSHTVEYNTVSGWNKPADEVVQINDGQTTTVAAGAQWRVDNNPWRNSGYTESGLSVGSHTAEYSTVTGWNKPADEVVQINDGQTTNTSGTYILQTGSVQVTISGTIPAGGQWRVDTGAWRNSGTTASSIPVGSHTITFFDVANYNEPADVPVTITDGGTEVILAGAYTPYPGSITVEITEPIPSGAQWRVDGGAWQLSEEIVGGLSAGGGGHLVEYDVVAGYEELDPNTIILAPGEDVVIIKTYVQQTGTLTVTISPQDAIDAGAQWSVDGVVWYGSGDEITLVLDIYMVEFSLVSGWQNPGPVEVEIFDDTQATVSRTYSPIQSVTLQINEVMASNNAAVQDPEGQFDDWFEIYNSTGSAVDMGGMYVVDDTLPLWRIPTGDQATIIPAGGYLVFWSDEDTLDGPLHVNFQLNADGDSLALYDTDGLTLIDSVTISDQITDVSYGRYLDGTPDFYYFNVASPGETNNDTLQTFAGQVADTTFSHDRGFYDVSFDVTITTATPGATIYYTLDDGSDPINPDGTPTSTAITYTGPVSITTTKSLRAAAVKTGWLPTNIDTQSYIFLDDVLLQDGTGLLPHDLTWGEFGPDWEMDPTVISTEPFTDDDGLSFTVKDALVAAPTLALTMNWDDWFDTSQGIYISGEGDERVCSAELISPDGSENGFQLNCTVQIVGGSSPNRWKMDKLSMRLKFRPRLDDGTPTGGPGRLRYDLFADTKVDSFNTIVLDARMNFSWPYGGSSSPTYQRLHAQYTRDQFPGDIHNDMGGYAPHGRPVHLYLNGMYWGMYLIHERPDSAFAESYLGGDKDDYDVLKHDPGFSNVVGFDDDPVAKQLSADNYDALSTAANQGLNDTGNYLAVLDLLDVEDFIDYMIMNFYIGNMDWAHHNWYATRSRVDPAGLWRYHSWDPEKGLQEIGHDRTTRDDGDGSPTDLHRDLRANDDYKRLFGDHVHKHFFNDGILTPPAIAQLYQKQIDQLDRVVVAESVRWGDNQEIESGLTYTRDAHWIPERDRLFNDYFPQRTDEVLGQLRTDGMYPNTEATVFNIDGSYQHGGYFEPANNELTMDDPYFGSGTIYYTLDGSDPRFDPLVAPASAPPAPAAMASAAVITSVVRANGSSGNRSPIGVFDGNTQCLASDAGGLADGLHVFSDRDYPYSNTPVEMVGSEYIRTFNTDKGAASTVTYTVTTSALAEVWIAVDDRFSGIQGRVDLAVANFAAAGVFTDTGLNVHVNESATNPARPLSVFSAELAPGTYVFQGGTVNSNNFYTIGAIGTDPNLNHMPVVDAGVAQTKIWPDNTVPMDANVTDDGKPVPPSLSLEWSLDNGPAGVTFDQLTFNPSEFVEDPQITFPQIGTYVLRLNADDSELVGTDTVTISVIDPPTAVEYTGPIPLTDSVHVKACVLYDNVWSALNEAPYAIDYAKDNLRITELMYHPTDPTPTEKAAAGDPNLIDEDFEFIELKNIGTTPYNLNLVHFTDGIDFTFANYTLAAGDYAVLVKNQAAFAARYNTTGINIVPGSYTGSLDNGGEEIVLRDAVDTEIHDFDYNDAWYDITDGGGFSLTIKDVDANDPNLWDQKAGWRPSAAVDGSPGWDDTGDVPEIGAIVINEILAHTDSYPNDWIELHNTTGSLINIGDWYLSDDAGDLTKYKITPGTSIAAGGYIVFTQDDDFGAAFALSENGETLYLHSGDGSGLTGYSEEESFGASESEVAFGRYQKSTGTFNFVAMSTNTPGYNIPPYENAYPKVGPIVINEIMYHPIDLAGNAEYIELKNITGSPVTLYDGTISEPWKMTDGIVYTFPSGSPTTIAAGDYFLLIKDLTAFTDEYGAPTPGKYAVWTDGSLSNGGEKVEISLPGDEVLGERQYIRVDRINYSDGSHPPGDDPWPPEPDDGITGTSLSRISPSNYGNDVINWQSAATTPGTANP
jgi:hypothetical protein